MIKMDVIAGPFDGAQTDFQTVVDYVPGTLRVFKPVLEKQAEVVELGGKDFRIVNAPYPEDLVLAFYRPFFP